MLYVLLIIIIFLLIKLVYFSEEAVNKRAVRRARKIFNTPKSVSEAWKKEWAEKLDKAQEALEDK